MRSMLSPRTLALSFVTAAMAACASSDPPDAPAGATADGGTTVTPAPTPSEPGDETDSGDGTRDDAGADGAPPADGGGDGASGDGGGGTGETCIGFGAKSPCGAAGKPDYGYVCFGGSPPGVSGCALASKSIAGETYCCTQLACVAQPDRDAADCKSAQRPHRYQCAVDEGNALLAQPPAGCSEDVGALIDKSSRFYCCP